MLHDIVYTVEDWYDGPRDGYADYRQKPHFYRSLHFDNDVYNPDEDRFELTPVSGQVVQWALVQHTLWQKWDKAYRAGTLPEEPDESIRILAEDLPRYHELCTLIEKDRQENAASSFVVRGQFASGKMQVQWYDLDSAAIAGSQGR